MDIEPQNVCDFTITGGLDVVPEPLRMAVHNITRKVFSLLQKSEQKKSTDKHWRLEQ